MGVIGSVGTSGCRASVDRAANVLPGTGEPRPGRPFWREALAPYARADLRRAMVDLATPVVPYVALWVLMYLALSVSYLVVLVIAVPAAGFLLRVYMVFHDCAHGSFLPSKRANVWLGTALGLMVFSPFQSWRHNHAVHHATAGVSSGAESATCSPSPSPSTPRGRGRGRGGWHIASSAVRS
jgi:fatty acid desaturase